MAGRPVRSLVAGTPRTGVPEVVVVPGLGAVGYLVPAVRACAAWTRVSVLDLPGFGHPSTARLPSDLAAVSGTTSAWLAETCRRPVLLVGHSTGAQAALRAALDARVAGLVLAGVTFSPEARTAGPLLGQVLRTVVHEPPGLVPAVLPYYRRGGRRVGTLLRSALHDRPEEAVGRLTAPLTVLRGEHDRVCPQHWASRLADGARAGARLSVLPGAHNIPWTSALHVSAALRRAALSPPRA